ncbi:hypothetical protein [Pseudomonas viridiflava]|uniref:hypothetical protein n=2 Tax=Pseudomonas viridiflava TaxID=33069 RepID=UPI000F0525C5|nr:hypothetical protein [Pseudomonas viridiflava]
MKLYKKLLLVTALLSSFVSVNTWAAAQSWNLARDMYIATEAAPPSSPWSFMQNKTAVNASANYTLFPTFFADTCNGSPVTCWREGSVAGSISIAKKTFTLSGSGTNYVLKQGDIYAHPGSSFQTIVRWASPIAGNINVLGRLNDLHNACGDGIKWSLNLGDTVLQSGSFANGGSSLIKVNDVAVTTTSLIYLVIDKKADNSCDSTSVDLFITN